MRIGLLGPAGDDEGALREAAEFLLGDAAVDQAIYLGLDDTVERVVVSWAKEITHGLADEDAFLERAASLACKGTPEEIETLLAADAQLERLSLLRTLPPPPARAIEMIDDRIVLVVHDKAILDEEDIANASLIVYGKSDEALLKRFGPRCFFTPGPLSAGCVGMVELERDGLIVVGLFDPSGVPLWREPLQGRTAKVSVTS